MTTSDSSVVKVREHWGSRLGLIMATAGSAIGLGSLWKFPYVTGMNGGGLFVLAFLVFTFLVGAPIFVAELLLGRAAAKSPVGTFVEFSSKEKSWKMVGWLCVLINFLILSYYSVVAGWAVNYTLMSLNQFTVGKTPKEIASLFDVLFTSGSLNLFWHFIFMLMTVGVVYGGIRKGIEFWAKILTPTFLVILLGLLAYAVTLDGFKQAVRFIFYPDFTAFQPSAILEALGLAFFTLSVGLGIMMTYGSYMRRTDNIPKTVLTVASMDIIVALLAALMIFPIIFTFGFTPTEGPGLLFKTMPVLFAKLPGSLIISTAFFVLVVFTALTSAISILEMLVSTWMELLGWSRRKSVLWTGAAAFVFGIPSALSGSGLLFAEWQTLYGRDFFSTIDYISNNILLPLCGFLIAIFAGWAVDKGLLKREFNQGTTWSACFGVWLFLIRFVAPLAIFCILLQKGGIINIDHLFG